MPPRKRTATSPTITDTSSNSPSPPPSSTTTTKFPASKKLKLSSPPSTKKTVAATPKKKTPVKKVETIEESDLPGEGCWKDWPAPRDQMELAKEFILEAVKDRHRILICPDKDTDGLSSALVLYHTLVSKLDHPRDLVSVYLLPKGINIHSEIAREEMMSVKCSSNGTDEVAGPTRAIVLDQGSRPGPPLLPIEQCQTLLIDHHQSVEFPESINVLSAAQSEPVATTSILTYLLCCTIVEDLKEDRISSMGALLGLYGDLGSSKINLSDSTLPWPTWLSQWEKKLTKTKLAKATALLNAPRRTPEFNARIAWDALLKSEGQLEEIMKDRGLNDAKERTSNETTRWQGAPPKFSKDGSCAVIKVDSGFQIHPVIATRWQGTLRNAKTLQAIMCANTGYTPGKVHFSCRAPRRSPTDSNYTGEPNLIEYLKGCIPKCEALAEGWGERVGLDFARGHKQATGGIIPAEEFEILMQALEIGVKADKSTTTPTKSAKGKGVIDAGQKNTLDGFFGIKPKKEEKE